jgi:hypothetical protein
MHTCVKKKKKKKKVENDVLASKGECTTIA